MEDLDKKVEVRMYFFVPYNISEIQKGIQCGHAVLRYARAFSSEDGVVWVIVDNPETCIILNGCTTNHARDLDGISVGTLNQIAEQIM